MSSLRVTNPTKIIDLPECWIVEEPNVVPYCISKDEAVTWCVEQREKIKELVETNPSLFEKRTAYYANGKDAAATVREQRDAKMAAFQWRLERYARQTRLGLPTTDTQEALDIYMQALADITEYPGFPWEDSEQIPWPVEP